jgi:hypothetical protein
MPPQHQCVASKGFSILMPPIRRPAWKSSVTSRAAPARRAASTMSASQKEKVGGGHQERLWSSSRSHVLPPWGVDSAMISLARRQELS